ncbi:MAG: tRNA lysidine(34) synthetase TilS [Desulforhopalus sp.]
MADIACHGKVPYSHIITSYRSIKLKLHLLQKKVLAEKSSMSILDRVASVIRTHSLINPNDGVVIAVSGGADSLALLHILHEINLPLKLTAIYIDHGLRPLETPHERKTIGESCRLLKIPFQIRTIDVNEFVVREKKSLEEAARILRYRALEEFRQECGAQVIAVGHTADDQVEEFFIRLIRGSGIRGLSGMKTKRDNIIRPLLYEKKEQLIDLLSTKHVDWCLDSSNLDRRFLRNRIRLDLLPLLEEDFNPALGKILLQNMNILAEDDDFINEQTETFYSRCVNLSDSTHSAQGSQLVISREKFIEFHPAIRRRIMEKSCWQMGIRPTYEHICTLVNLIEYGKNGAELHLDAGVRAEKSVNKLILERPLPKGLIRGSKEFSPSISHAIPGTGIYNIFEVNKELVLKERSVSEDDEKPEDELWIDLDKIRFPLHLRSFLPGERFYPYNGPGSKKISRYFNEKKIPAKERPGWPVLLSGDRIVALVGLQIDDNFRITTDTRKILSISWRAL